MGNPRRQTFNTSGINTQQPCTDPETALPALELAPSPSPEQSLPLAKPGSLPRVTAHHRHTRHRPPPAPGGVKLLWQHQLM